MYSSVQNSQLYPHGQPAQGVYHSAAAVPSMAAVPSGYIGTGLTAPQMSLSPQEEAFYPMLFRVANKSGKTRLSGSEAADFLAKSKLARKTLHDIWNLADSDDMGSLSPFDFYKACRLVAHAQSGVVVITPQLLNMEPPVLPVFEGIEADESTIKRSKAAPGGAVESSLSPIWQLTRKHLQKYTEVFRSLAKDGFVGGLAAKNFMTKSHVDQKELSNIWDLADKDRDGKLSYSEFLVAMHLISRAREGYKMPDKLPPALKAILTTPPEMPPSHETESSSPVEQEAKQESVPATSPALGQNQQQNAYARPSLAGSYKMDGSSNDIGFGSKAKLDTEDKYGEGDAASPELEQDFRDQRAELARQLARKQDVDRMLNEARARLEELRSKKRDLDKKYTDVTAALEGQQTAVLSTKKQLDEAVKEINDVRQLAIQEGEPLATDSADVVAAVRSEKDKVNSADAKIQDLRGQIDRINRQKEDLQSQNAVWLERQRQAEQDRTMLIGALEKERANLASVRAERLRTWEQRHEVSKDITSISVKQWQDTTGSAPKIPDSSKGVVASQGAAGAPHSPVDPRKGIPAKQASPVVTVRRLGDPMVSTGAGSDSAEDLVEAGFFPTTPITYTEKDAILYALGVGATERKYVYENHPDFAVLPAMIFATIFKGDESSKTLPFPPPQLLMDLDIFKGKVIIDAERSMEVLKGPLPVRVSLSDKWGMKTRFTALTPKKAGLLVETETLIVDELAGDAVLRLTNSLFFLGKTDLDAAGSPSKIKIAVPDDQQPDHTITEQTSLNQADLYRLSGDYNPLHVDPATAKSYGFEQPILHGLCTLGFAARHVINACLEGDGQRLKSFRCRFTKPVIPGDRLRTEIWEDSSGCGVSFRTRAERCTGGEDGTPADPIIVLDGGAAQFFS
ncbi:hypothetical protein FOZ60_011787 [Perkinsus olseni]|uniref:Uncharacterized protein n=1 Tax=Perkinsus olseni TaxID=32597 RepID=A0A7J6PLU8_PEROL|nr:hypothetical protein FOZ60_011787 [Perkinsus olseni]